MKQRGEGEGEGVKCELEDEPVGSFATLFLMNFICMITLFIMNSICMI